MNYAVIPSLRALASTRATGNTGRALRQVINEPFHVGPERRWSLAQDSSSGALLIERRDASGVRVAVPIQVNQSTGLITFNDAATFAGTFDLGNGATLGLGTGTGVRIGYGSSKMGFYGATPNAKQTGTPAAAPTWRRP